MIKLKSFKIKDWKYIEKWIPNESELIQFAGSIFSFPIDQNQVRNYLADSNRTVFRVEADNGQTVGIAEISMQTNTVAKLARILIGEKSMRGKGVGTTLIKKLNEYAFYNLKAKSVILNVYSWNVGAIKCYEKVGFLRTSKPITYEQVGNEKWETMEMEIQQLGDIV